LLTAALLENVVRWIKNSVVVVLAWLFLWPATAFGAQAHKIYVINRYGAYDIVCDSYTVKENDHIWDILRRKGSIAEEDFPKFVKMLRDMNPGIRDVNKIYPRQRILIPLKEMPARGLRAEAGPRYVTIPMIPDVLYRNHEVHAGECLSKIIAAHLQVRWSQLSSAYLETFKRLNPRISDLDLIYPGQTVRIPELAALEPPDTDATLVAARDDEQSQDPDPKVVGTESPAEELVVEAEKPLPRELEPIILSDKGTSGVLGADLPARADRPESGALTASDALGSETQKAVSPAKVLFKDGVDIITSEQTTDVPPWQRMVSIAATRIGGTLLSSGHCYFPGKEQRDVALDLAAFPVIELPRGQHVLLEKTVRLPENTEKTIRASWKGLLVVRAGMAESGREVLEKVFRAIYGEHIRKDRVLLPLDDGIQVGLRGDWVFHDGRIRAEHSPYYCITLMDSPEESTFPAVIEYLAPYKIHIVDIMNSEKQQEPRDKSLLRGRPLQAVPLFLDGSSAETFVAGFVKALGYWYETQVPLSFEYAGFQVQTTANIIYGPEGMDVVVDYGTFYGDAKAAIGAGGMTVVSIDSEAGPLAIAESVLNALDSVYTKDPVLQAADRELSKTVSLAVPGYLISYGRGKKALLPSKNLHPKMVAFLHTQQIDIFQVKTTRS
jgi:hypothetical protein